MVKVIVEVWACDDSGHDTIREIEVRRKECPSIGLTLDHNQTVNRKDKFLKILDVNESATNQEYTEACEDGYNIQQPLAYEP